MVTGRLPDDPSVWELAGKLAKESPRAFALYEKAYLAHAERTHRLALIDRGIRAGGILLGFGSVVTLAILAWHYGDIDAAKYGAGIMTGAAVSIVAIFVTGKLLQRSPRSATQVSDAAAPPRRSPQSPTGSAAVEPMPVPYPPQVQSPG